MPCLTSFKLVSGTGASSNSLSVVYARAVRSTGHRMPVEGKHGRRAEDLIEISEYASRARLTMKAAMRLVDAMRLICIQIDGTDYVPAFFLDPSIDRRQLERVCRRLAGCGHSAVRRFFLARLVSLGGATPLEALRSGRIGAVIVSATAFAER